MTTTFGPDLPNKSLLTQGRQSFQHIFGTSANAFIAGVNAGAPGFAHAVPA